MFLQTSGAGAATPAVTAPPSVQRFTSGSGTYNLNYTFIITAGSATVGATYTNNSITYTVYATVASSTQVVMSGSGAPLSSGVLTKASGTGDSTLAFSLVLTPLYLQVEMVGGGGGAAGNGTAASGGAGSSGGNTTFGSSLLTANGATGGQISGGSPSSYAGGTGGSATVSSPAITLVALQGGSGQSIVGNLAGVSASGGMGGVSPFGGAAGGTLSGTGLSAMANSGSGGGGSGATATLNGGAGGGAGGYVKALINNPSATYSYAVGASGAGGTAGTSGNAGGAGGSGVVIVTEFYQYDNTQNQNVGIAIVDFGAFPGASDASLVITGQTRILAGSVVTCSITPVATADHSEDEHRVERLECYAGSIVPGTGFTVYVTNVNNLSEPFVIQQSAGSMYQTSATAVGFKVCPPGKNLSDYSGKIPIVYGKWSISWSWN